MSGPPPTAIKATRTPLSAKNSRFQGLKKVTVTKLEKVKSKRKVSKEVSKEERKLEKEERRLEKEREKRDTVYINPLLAMRRGSEPGPTVSSIPLQQLQPLQQQQQQPPSQQQQQQSQHPSTPRSDDKWRRSKAFPFPLLYAIKG